MVKKTKQEALSVLKARISFHLRTAKHYRAEARKLKKAIDKAEKLG